MLGVDMSEAYIRYARRYLRRRARVNLLVGKAEALPVADASQDAVTCIFTVHELPPEIRRALFTECARVLKPGGRFVLLDSIQRGDRPDYEGLLELFPQNFHEPYYASYLTEDFGAIARACELAHVRDVPAFVSKVMVFDKMRTSS
jgi:ubiquinone/menaquinone biosynthesis C-methylase UbiE